MNKEEINIIFTPESTYEEKNEQIKKQIDAIESSGGRIVGGEPIEKLYVKIIGRRFIVERD